MNVVALAGGVGAGKFLRGLARVVPGDELTVVVNTADDITIHGLHVSPDVDSVIYAMGEAADRDRGWGRADESFRATGELRERFAAKDAWFNLGDLDLATHLRRTDLLRRGRSLTEAVGEIAAAFEVGARVLPMSDDPVATHLSVTDSDGGQVDRHFQEFWVRYRAAEPVSAIRYEGAPHARPGPSVIAAIEGADALVICPSNPVASIGPILAVPGIRRAMVVRRERAVGISPIIGGAPVRGMADKLMPVAGLEVSALGAARAYDGLLAAWVIDTVDRELATSIETELGMRVGITTTLMDDHDDGVAEALARYALEMLG